MAESPLLEEQRENWGSRTGFVLAAIGSAVGLGNLWGFPYKLYDNGGGAFLIPYVIAMLLVGIPLLIAEFSLGHLTQRATPDAFGRAHRKFAFVGWWQIALSFVIITYYAVILAYCLSFLYFSIRGLFAGSLPWAGRGIEGVQNAKNFFFRDYLQFHEGFSLGRLQTHIVGALAITWGLMYLCIFRGVKLVGKVVLWTVPLPWLMLLILTIRGMTLPGAIQGLEYYLEPDWTRLADPLTWRRAFGQMFFSMSLAFGIMITYASFLHRKSDLNNNAAVIGLADLGTSFVAGLAVFATLGGMAFATVQAGQPVPVNEVVNGGPSLAFVAFPYALAQLPHAAWFSTLFFASLLLLGIDSAFSITECVLASIVDKTGWSRGKTLVGITLVGFAVGLVYCFQGGLNWLGTFDDFINGTWGIALTAQALVLGWLFRIRRLRRHANERSDWRIGRWFTWLVRLFIPIVMAALFSWSLFDDWSNPHFLRDAEGNLQIGTIAGLSLMAAAPIAAVIISMLRFKGTPPNQPLVTDYADPRPHGLAAGIVSILLAGISLASFVAAFGALARRDFALPAAGAAGALAMILGGLAVVRFEGRSCKTHMLARLGAAGGVLCLGLTAGLGLAMWVRFQKYAPRGIVYDNELSATGYLIMAGILGIIFLGLGWCFYRALRAAAEKEESQTAEL